MNDKTIAAYAAMAWEDFISRVEATNPRTLQRRDFMSVAIDLCKIVLDEQSKRHIQAMETSQKTREQSAEIDRNSKRWAELIRSHPQAFQSLIGK